MSVLFFVQNKTEKMTTMFFKNFRLPYFLGLWPRFLTFFQSGFSQPAQPTAGTGSAVTIEYGYYHRVVTITGNMVPYFNH